VKVEVQLVLSITPGILQLMFWPAEGWTYWEWHWDKHEWWALCVGPFHLEWFSNT
jgi:hypothetical protein